MPPLSDEPYTSNEPGTNHPFIKGSESDAENSAADHASTFEMLYDEMEGRIEEKSSYVWNQLLVDDENNDFVTAEMPGDQYPAFDPTAQSPASGKDRPQNGRAYQYTKTRDNVHSGQYPGFKASLTKEER